MTRQRTLFILTFSGLLSALSGCVTAQRAPATPQAQLLDAVNMGKIEVVQKLLAEGVQPGTDAENGSGIINAYFYGHKDIVRIILKKCVDIYVKGMNCSDAHLGAAYMGDSASLIALLDKGADPNGPEKSPPLYLAAYDGRTECAKILIKRGADIDLAIQTLERDMAGRSEYSSPAVAQMFSKARAGIKFLERLRPTLDPVAGPAGGMSREDLTKIVQTAVAGAAQAAAKPAVAILSSDVDQPSFKLPQRTDDFAVVVGIEKYSEVPPAQFADRDAKAMRDSLVAMGYPERNIVLLQGDRATKTGIIKNLETWLPRNINEKSTVFFYYSGHGAPDPKTGQAYLVPYDGDPQYLEDTGYPMKRLYEKLGALKVKQVIVAMDSCFSGAGGRSVLAKGTRPLVGKVDLGQAGGRNIISLTASASDQISGTIDEQGHGAFTYYLLRGINGAARDDKGTVTIKSLYEYLLPNVQDSAHRSNRDQTPQLQDVGSTSASLRLR